VVTEFEQIERDGSRVIRLRSPQLEVDVAPEIGGRVVQIRHRASGHEFLWNNRGLLLQPQPAGAEYDPHFFGGIDELLPNDIPETVDGVAYPDHGELWTHRFHWRVDGTTLMVEGQFPLSELTYERRTRLRADSPHIDMHYRITNAATRARHFLWKLHAAVAVAEGDVIDCPARQAQVVDPQYSRFQQLSPFRWPDIEGQRADRVPPDQGTMDFFYLFDLEAGRVAWRRPASGLKFEYTFDAAVFPCTWLFASYGGFQGHYTVILEPCTTMPISVSEAMQRGRCSRLLPGETLETDVTMYAGPE
jgi:hypothetical protein